MTRNGEQHNKHDSKLGIYIAVFLSLCLIASGLGLAILSILKAVNFHSGNSHNAQAQATVTKIIVKRMENGRIACKVDYKFQVSGITYSSPKGDDTASYNSSNCIMAEGETISINYQPDDPSKNSFSNDGKPTTQRFTSAIATLPISLILIFVGGYSLHIVNQSRQNSRPDISQYREQNIIHQTKSDPRFK